MESMQRKDSGRVLCTLRTHLSGRGVDAKSASERVLAGPGRGRIRPKSGSSPGEAGAVQAEKTGRGVGGVRHGQPQVALSAKLIAL